MKKLFIALLLVAGLFTACQSEAESCIKKMGDLIEKVVKEGSKYTSEDWDKISQEFDELVEEAQQIKDLTDEQKAEISKLQGKFSGTVMKQGFDSLMKDGTKELEKVGSAIEGFLEGLSDGEKKDDSK